MDNPLAFSTCRVLCDHHQLPLCLWSPPGSGHVAFLSAHTFALKTDFWGGPQVYQVLSPRNLGFPSGPVVKNMAHNAGDVGSIAGRRSKTPPAAEQLSLCTATGASMRHKERPCVPQLRPNTARSYWHISRMPSDLHYVGDNI